MVCSGPQEQNALHSAGSSFVHSSLPAPPPLPFPPTPDILHISLPSPSPPLYTASRAARCLLMHVGTCAPMAHDGRSGARRPTEQGRNARRPMAAWLMDCIVARRCVSSMGFI